MLPGTGRAAVTIWTRDPGRIVRPMDEPDASTQRGRGRPAADLSAAAIVAGCIVDISGVPVALSASDDRRGGVLSAALGRLPAHAGPPVAQIAFASRIPPRPEAPPDESYAGMFHVWRRGAELYLAHGTQTAGRVTVDGAEFGGSPTPAFRHLMPLALGHILGFSGRFVVHAGVIGWDRKVALVFGDSGSGKSTLAIAGLQAGWRVLSDDLAIVQAHRNRVGVTTLGLPLVFPDDVLDAPIRGSRPLAGDPRHRWTLSVPRDSKWRPVSDILLPHRDTVSGGSLAPLASLEVFEQAVSAFVAATEPLLLRRYLPIAGALSRVPGWRVGLAPDPGTRRDGLAKVLEAVLSGPAPSSKGSRGS